jgi:central glycolytic genes regulator
MGQVLGILNKVIPKEMDVLRRRYSLLKTIQVMQPVGRRVLSAKLDVGEKIIRHDTDFFREEGYLQVTLGGMMLTEEGIHILEELRTVMQEFESIKNIQEKLKSVLGCNDITVVIGDTDTEPNAMNNIGKAAADLLQKLMKDDSIVAITGGHTIKSMVKHIKTTPDQESNRIIVPARGSLGNDIETQANTLVELMAKKLNCQYRLLNLPDNLSEKAIESVYKDPSIKKIIKDIKKSNIIVFGIGNAKKMAYRRDLNKKIVKILDEKKRLQKH